MAGPALLNSPYVNRPPLVAGSKMVVVGDGKRGPDAGPNPDMPRSATSVPYSQATSIAYNPANKVLVVATKEAGKPLMVSNDEGRTWRAATVPATFKGFIDRLYFEPLINSFVGASGYKDAAESEILNLRGSADGLTWQVGVFLNPRRRTTGYAFSPQLSRSLFFNSGGANNIWYTNGISSQTANLSGTGWSVVWFEKNDQFLAVRPGSQGVKASDNGINWVDYQYALPAAIGDVAGDFAFYCIERPPAGNRLLLFTVGGTAPAWYSDNNGQTWTACQGIENTGSVTRYVAVDSNAVYVAFNAELNKGMVSFDYGQTWERSDHLSGNASGVTTL